ncbi:MAG: DNA-3-methyladenine glycosylase 2 family protein [Planctomycetota bacterium]|nr:DNA-3-methyladenine glycosylase 2 family protein [Planctomycetota bacterium]
MATPSPAALKALARRDPALGRVMKRLEPLPDFPGTDSSDVRSHFGYLLRAIAFQQLAGAAAATIWGRVCRLTPGPSAPKPPELQSLKDEPLRAAGLSRAKLAAYRDLSERVLDGRLKLRGIGNCSDDEVISRLSEVRGIGEWSAQMFLMFRLGRLDVLPCGDLGVQEGLRLLDGLDERPRPKELAFRGERWGPLASVGTWLMWRLVDEEREG